MEPFEELCALCTNSVTLTVNDHRDYCQTVEEFLTDEQAAFREKLESETDDVKAKMIEMNQVVCLQAYPRSAGGFYVIYHWSIPMAVEKMIEVIKANKQAQ